MRASSTAVFQQCYGSVTAVLWQCYSGVATLLRRCYTCFNSLVRLRTTLLTFSRSQFAGTLMTDFSRLNGTQGVVGLDSEANIGSGKKKKKKRRHRYGALTRLPQPSLVRSASDVFADVFADLPANVSPDVSRDVFARASAPAKPRILFPFVRSRNHLCASDLAIISQTPFLNAIAIPLPTHQHQRSSRKTWAINY